MATLGLHNSSEKSRGVKLVRKQGKKINTVSLVLFQSILENSSRLQKGVYFYILNLISLLSRVTNVLDIVT